MEGEIMRLEPIGNPIDEKAGEVAGLVAGWTADAVGGRNLLEKSGGDYLSTAGHTYNPSIVEVDGKKALAFNSSRNIINLVGTDVELKEGDKISFSFKAKASIPLSIGRLYIGPGNGNGNLLRHQMVSTEWAEYSISITVRNPGKVHIYMYPQIDNEDGTYETFYVTEWKLEYGLKPTPWTPAPEDLRGHVRKGNALDTFPSPLPPADPDLMIRTDNSVGNRIFVGDTMIYGDTGWRDVRTLMDSSWTAADLHLRREGGLIFLRARDLTYSGDLTGSQKLMNLPQGFRTGSPNYFATGLLHPYASVQNLEAWAVIGGVGGQGVLAPSGLGRPLNGQFMFPSPNPWPETLPGVPVN